MTDGEPTKSNTLQQPPTSNESHQQPGTTATPSANSSKGQPQSLQEAAMALAPPSLCLHRHQRPTTYEPVSRSNSRGRIFKDKPASRILELMVLCTTVWLRKKSHKNSQGTTTAHRHRCPECKKKS
ncbi:hypothetical protein DVH24_032909 [Malus domestica]|uniref:Uncharacterized protein n=1 Tax=Malus domestica TaxID=3750 RepID=A0A498IR54_MALDO|nr:hypothetical protein DVH24_032909 [Malus domestica]